MSTGHWTPEPAGSAIALDAATLRELLALSRREQLQDLPDAVGAAMQRWLAEAMHRPGGEWADAADPLDNDELIHLMRTLAVVEMRLPGCSVGDKSPVIALNRLLKARGARLDAAQLQWLRQHSSNRFLPNGPAL